jgi:hypothetical protein
MDVLFILREVQTEQYFEGIGVVNAEPLKANYSYIDQESFYARSFYRLKMEDIDGSMQYSPVRTIFLNVPAKQAEVYPNPSEGLVKITHISTGAEIGIFNATGQRVLYKLSAGREDTIDMAQLPKGIYSLHIIRVKENTCQIIKLVKD